MFLMIKKTVPQPKFKTLKYINYNKIGNLISKTFQEIFQQYING